MNLKLLFIINDNEKKLISLTDRFGLPFNTIMHGEGTASQGILDFLGLAKTNKNILMSFIPDAMEDAILSFLKKETKIKEIGKGIAFTIPLACTTKYICDTFAKVEGEKMKNERKFQLIMAITEEGNAEKIMNIAKKNGANGGTLIKGRSVGGKNSFKLFNLTVEPEKDLVLIVSNNNSTKKIMQGILEKNGMNTESKTMCFSLPIDNTVGIDE